MLRLALALVLGAAISCAPRTSPRPEQPGNALVASVDPPGQRLERGMSLAYGSNGREQPAWLIDSVHRGVSHAGRAGCVRVWLRRGGPSSPAEQRFLCRGGDTLFAWNAAANEWRPDRPVGTDMRLTVTQPSGARLVYETAKAADRLVGEERVPYVATTIVTVDTAGRVVRRLRESYAISLVTALDGVLEVPDAANRGSWREQLRFELIRIERPMPR